MSREFVIDSQFPSGNIIVDRIEGDDVYLHQDLRDTFREWFYWAFRISGAGGRTLRFRFTESPVMGSRGPAVSLDQGRSWFWHQSPDTDDHTFSFTFPLDAQDVRFSFAMPYTEADLQRFLNDHRGNGRLAMQTLCTTPGGRDVELLRIGDETRRPVHRILITGRHHACESIASFAMEGFLAEALSDSETGDWYRDSVNMVVVPFIDKDGVEAGDQGKYRAPHDHNRDYQDDGIYPTVRALREFAASWAGDRLRVALDFHCPARRGEGHEHIHLVEPEGTFDRDIWAGILALSTALERANTSSLPYAATENLRFGERWNVQTDEGVTFSTWAAELPGVVASATLEIPYAIVHGVEVNPHRAREFGACLAQAVRAFLSS